MAKNEKVALWTERIQELRSSGLTVKEWCLEHNISCSTMGYWMRKLKEKESPKDDELIFAKLPSEKEISKRKFPAKENNIAVPSSLQIFISETVRIDISDTCRPELLEYLLKVLTNHA